MVDVPLISDLASVEAAYRHAIGAGELLIYVHPHGAHLAGELRQLARYFEIGAAVSASAGIGIYGRARAVPAEVADAEITNLLEQVVLVVRTAQQQAVRQLHAAQESLKARTVEVYEADRRSTLSQGRKEALERRLQLAMQQPDKVKQTLSFRLGHALIHNTKSVKGMLELPKVLWGLRKDASARREDQHRGA